MSILVNGLRDLNLNDPKLNITNSTATNTIAKDSSAIKMSELNTKSFKISPRKENFMNQLSPLKSPTNPNPSFNILKESTNISVGSSTISDVLNSPLSASPIHTQQPSAIEFRRKVKEVTDLKIVNEDLIKELEKLQDEISHKNQIIDIKSMKVDELMHENNRLLSNIKLERESNENDFNSWLDLKTNLELQIHSLKQHNTVDDDILNTSDDKINQSLESIEDESETDMFNKLQLYKTEVNKLKKKVTALRKENELEVQSKIMIMDELEMMRERYLEVDEKHEILKLDYEELVNELLLLKSEEDDFDSDAVGGDSVITPTLNTSKEMSSQGSNGDKDLDDRILKIRKKRIRSKSSNNSNEENSRIASLRNNSLNKAIREVELKSQKQKYSQELIKYEFEIKSLKLQNEKLLSYIGYTLQVNGIDVNNGLGLEHFKNLDSANMNKCNSNSILNDRIPSYGSTISNKTATFDNIDYSDAYNIKTAQKNLKTVIKSASALPIRPDTLNLFNNNVSGLQPLSQPITIKKMHRSNTNGSTNGRLQNARSIEFSYANNNNSTGNINNDNDSFMDMQSNSIDYSTDYNQGEVECLDIGGSDSFEEYGDDELDEEDHMLLHHHHETPEMNIPITDSNLNALNNANNATGNRLSKNKKVFTSTDSLNVSYKMNFMNPKNFKNSKPSKITPRTQLKRITPSVLNLKKKPGIVNTVEEPVVTSTSEDILTPDIFHNDILHVEDDDGDDISIDDMNIINGDEEEYLDMVESDMEFEVKQHGQVKERKHVGNKNTKYFSMYQISEEDESEYDDNYKMQFSSSEEEEDDGDEDETFNISNQEIDMFKIDFLRRLYCPKHSMFQCFCRSMDLVNPLYFKIFSSPIYSLRRKLRRQYERKSPSLNSLKLKSKLLTTQSANAGTGSNVNANGTSSTKRSHPMRYHKHEKGLEQFQSVAMNNSSVSTVATNERDDQSKKGTIEEEEEDEEDDDHDDEDEDEDEEEDCEHGYCCGGHGTNKDILGGLVEGGDAKKEELLEVEDDILVVD